ncbi:MAG: hypothetical protein JXR37_07530 [Kiritimatiellae bacterium]|nr:hypothetical protein [Kiritimatiellia bacterium]
MAQVSIDGTEFRIDGEPTYAGREFEGCRIQGLLFNARVVQATFDDANPQTRKLWAYPDTGEWDAERNVNEFCAALESWRDHGVLGFTINFQGGGPRYSEAIYTAFDNNGFTPDGAVKPAYARRIERVLARADELGMVPIMGLFYCAHLKKLDGEQAVWRAADAALAFLESTGRRNFVIEVANEIEPCVGRSGYAVFAPERHHEMVNRLKAAHPGLLISSSHGGASVEKGRCLPTPALLEAVDFVLLHGNGNRAPQLEAAIRHVQAMPEYRANPKPIVINEDSPGIPNLDAAWRNGASWGYYDQGFAGPDAWGGDAYVDFRSRPREARYEALSGFQTPPVNWTINTEHKRAFFGRVAQVTGYDRNVM